MNNASLTRARRSGALLSSGLLLLCALLAPQTYGADVAIPLTIDGHHLDSAVELALHMDADHRATLAENACNRVEIADPKVHTDQGPLEVELTLVVTTALEVMGECRGPEPWHGQMTVELKPRTDDSGLAVVFTPLGAQVWRGDGTEGLLSQPAKVLAEKLILPQLGQVRVDLAAPLRAIDDLLAELQKTGAETPPPLVKRCHIQSLAVLPEGLRATLSFALAPHPVAAGPEPVLTPEELAEWARVEDELDGFLTTIIAMLAETADTRDLRFELLGVLLDARYAIAQALTENHPGGDPVRKLFADTWDRLRPHLATLARANLPALGNDLRLAGFIAGGDALRALDGLGPEYGIEITRDGLRRLARLLLADAAPASFTPLPLEVDQRLRNLFLLDDSETSRGGPMFQNLVQWLVPAAQAAESAPRLATKVPSPGELQAYLTQVAAILDDKANARLGRDSHLPQRLAKSFNPLVRATAWKESCWRQFVGTAAKPEVLKSPVGAVGMMQINGRVWRGLYDLKRLAEETDYNIAAGAEILDHYLVDYALRRGENRRPGGDDNLIRATYAAYNGGPGQLSRYRRTDTPQWQRAIDNAFWDHYQQMKTKGWPDVASCYPEIS
ncbi:MAG: lytic transglycosylase domain-containing protein [Porticoccaceae bacterium]